MVRATLAKFTGLKAMVASAFLFAVMAALIKAAAEEVPTAQIVFVRNLIHVAIFVPLWWATTDRTLGNGKLLALRGLLGLAALEAYAWTLGRMPLADAWILQAMNPLFVAMLAPRLLGEPSHGRVWTALALGLAGAMLIVRPGFHVAWLPGVVGLFGGLMAALAYMSVRVLGRSERPLTVVMAFPIVATPLSAPWGLAVWQTPNALEWAAMGAAALAAAGGQMLLTIGLKGERAAPAATATYSGFVFAAVIEWFAFTHLPEWQTVLGAVLTFAAVWLLSRGPVTPPVGSPVVVPDGTVEM